MWYQIFTTCMPKVEIVHFSLVLKLLFAEHKPASCRYHHVSWKCTILSKYQKSIFDDTPSVILTFYYHQNRKLPIGVTAELKYVDFTCVFLIFNKKAWHLWQPLLPRKSSCWGVGGKINLPLGEVRSKKQEARSKNLKKRRKLSQGSHTPWGKASANYDQYY